MKAIEKDTQTYTFNWDCLMSGGVLGVRFMCFQKMWKYHYDICMCEYSGVSTQLGSKLDNRTLFDGI